MFRCWESLKEIDLSKLKVKDNTILDDMFNSCFSLKVIKCDDKIFLMNMNKIKMRIKIIIKLIISIIKVECPI